MPLRLEGKVGSKDITPLELTKREDIVRDVDDSFYKINKDTTGFYRTNYPPARLATLGGQIERLSLSDKIGQSNLLFQLEILLTLSRTCR